MTQTDNINFDNYIEDNFYKYKAHITKIYDGDTPTADISLGFGVIIKNQKIRLFGIDTPELKGGSEEDKKHGYQARDFLIEKILNKDVTLHTIKTKNNEDKKGKFGRWLAIIFYNGININKLLVDQGYAKYKIY
jgi:micrococcal nuclease